MTDALLCFQTFFHSLERPKTGDSIIAKKKHLVYVSLEDDTSFFPSLFSCQLSFYLLQYANGFKALNVIRGELENNVRTYKQSFNKSLNIWDHFSSP